MAENSTLHNGAINDLYLTDGITKLNLLILMFVIHGPFIVVSLICTVTILYMCCKAIITTRSKYSADPTSTRIMHMESTVRWMARFCRIIEQFTVWLLVDLFCTPKVKKEVKNGKLHLKIGDHRSWQLGERATETGLIFAITSLILCFYINNLIVNCFVKLTPTCNNNGDFGVPAACYALNITESFCNFLVLLDSETLHQINCTTWNNNLESFKEEIGPIFCFSFYYDILKSMTEIVGMFALQTLIIQVLLSIIGEVQKNSTCIIYLLSGITIMTLVNITTAIFFLSQYANPRDEKGCYEIRWQQLTPMLVAILSSMLLFFLLMFSNDSRKIKNTATISNRRNDHQGNSVTTKQKEEQSDGENTKDSRWTQDHSIDKRRFETTHHHKTSQSHYTQLHYRKGTHYERTQ